MISDRAARWAHRRSELAVTWPASAFTTTVVELNKQFADMTALGRVGVPDDIGPMIAGLQGADNRWVAAQRIESQASRRSE